MTIAAIANFDAVQFVNSLISLGAAFLLGTAIGAERQYRQRSAGLRTTVLVAVGAAAFVDIGMRLNGNASAAHVLAYVVSGIGFLGAGVIMKEGLNIRGLNTAATLWGSAAVGASAGADRIAEALLIAVFVLAANTALRPLVNAINRQPLDETATEATYEIQITTSPEALPTAREMLMERLDAKNYAVREAETEERAEDRIELTVTLAASTAEGAELDEVVAALEKVAGVHHATWSMRTTD
jgi:putative Mg2+ transporter-C (MgtC) family protein